MALAYRPLPRRLTWHLVQRINRDKLECDLKFLGLLILQNMLKPESTPVIHTLHGARIKCLMVTGDNLLTAISVARDCDMVPGTTQVIVLKASVNEASNTVMVDSEPAEHCAGIRGRTSGPKQIDCSLEMEAIKDFTFAVDGRSFSIISSNFPKLYEKLLVRGTVFARMLPDQKRQLVEDLRDLGYVVGMCGDGANDCGALRAADVGISLSEAESSVAAPFTSKTPNIQCVPIVVREGRCALVTAFQTFKFVALYSLIQFISVLLLYSVQTNMSDPMFLYVDLLVITTLAVTMSHTEAYPFLVPAQPSSSLVSVANLTSVGLQLTIVILGQAGMLAFLQAQPWYIPIRHDPNDDVYDYWDTATVFFVSCYQYLIMAVVFSTGPPFQRPFWTNRWFLGNLILLSGSTTFLLFDCVPVINTFFQMIVWRLYEKIHFRITLLLVCCLSLVVSYFAEVYVAQSSALKRLHRFVIPKRSSKNRYKVIDKDVSGEQWTTDRKFLTDTESGYQA